MYDTKTLWVSLLGLILVGALQYFTKGVGYAGVAPIAFYALLSVCPVNHRLS